MVASTHYRLLSVSHMGKEGFDDAWQVFVDIFKVLN